MYFGRKLKIYLSIKFGTEYDFVLEKPSNDDVIMK